MMGRCKHHCMCYFEGGRCCNCGAVDYDEEPDEEGFAGAGPGTEDIELDVSLEPSMGQLAVNRTLHFPSPLHRGSEGHQQGRYTINRK